MTTKFLDNKICTFKIFVVEAFPTRKQRCGWFSSQPPNAPPPLKTANFLFYCRLALSLCDLVLMHLYSPCRCKPANHAQWSNHQNREKRVSKSKDANLEKGGLSQKIPFPCGALQRTGIFWLKLPFPGRWEMGLSTPKASFPDFSGKIKKGAFFHGNPPPLSWKFL